MILIISLPSIIILIRIRMLIFIIISRSFMIVIPPLQSDNIRIIKVDIIIKDRIRVGIIIMAEVVTIIGDE